MKIGLVDVDSHNFPNIPLMKISAYHKAQGDTVEWHIPLDTYDIVYVSKVFTIEYTDDYPFTINAEQIIKGGTGYDIKNKLPTEIETMCPDCSLYPQYSESYGFLTRGCPRNCPFCVVSKKEGRKSVQVADIDQFYRGQKTIKLLDPNLLACKDREKLLQQLIDSKAWIDFTQGLDIRMADKDITQLLNKVKVKMLHFAWDNPKEDLTDMFVKFDSYSKIKDERKRRVYVLTNFNSTHEEDLYRIYTLQRLGYDPYVMIFDKYNAPQQTRHLARWCNNKWVYRSCPKYEDYDSRLA